MIRLARDEDFDRPITTESELRICGLKEAYGLSVPFIQFYADEHRALASIMDGYCVFYCAGTVNDEWLSFLRMHPDVRVIHTTGEIGVYLADEYRLPSTSGMVMVYNNTESNSPLQLETPSIQRVYELLSTVFPDYPAFDSWYVDVSHRVRHGCCHVAAIEEDGLIISTAMTVAETTNVALIGGVATLPQYRGLGHASRCIHMLMTALRQKTVYIAPSDDDSKRLYTALGFTAQGSWAEIDMV